MSFSFNCAKFRPPAAPAPQAPPAAAAAAAPQAAAVEGVPKGLLSALKTPLNRWSGTRDIPLKIQAQRIAVEKIKAYCLDPSSKTLDFSDLAHLPSLPNEIIRLPEVETVALHREAIAVVIHSAIEIGSLELIQWLFPRVKNLDSYNWESQQYTPLMVAYLSRQKEICIWLIEKQGIATKNGLGDTILTVAALRNDKKHVLCLLKKNPDPSIITQAISRTRKKSVNGSHMEIIRALIEALPEDVIQGPEDHPES